MIRSGIIYFCLFLLLAACAPPAAAQDVPGIMAPTASAIPAVSMLTLTLAPGATPSITPQVDEALFSKISRSTDVLHQKCDPLEIIFDVTVKSADTKGVVFFFRMKDKATGIVNGWSNGENMRPMGNGVYEFIFRSSAIPDEARFKDAWVQYQFVGVNQALQSLGNSQIVSNELTFTPACP